MSEDTSRILSSLISAVGLLACTAKSPEPAPDLDAEQIEPVGTTPQPASEPAPSEPAPSEPKPAEPSEPEPAEPEPSKPAPIEHLGVTEVNLEPHVVAWREVATLPGDAAPRGFVYFATGILAGTYPNFYSVDATGTLVSVTIDEPPGALSGQWPEEAWAIERSPNDSTDDEATGRLRLHRLRNNTRWVPQTIAGDTWIARESVEVLRKSWKVGYLVKTNAGLLRVAGGSSANPDHSAPSPWQLKDLVESRSGRIYALLGSALDEDEGYGDALVQAPCTARACKGPNLMYLPDGDWSWDHSIPRQKHDVSIIAVGGSEGNILHFEAGDWKLENLNRVDLEALWPTNDGGMWAQANIWSQEPSRRRLLHRDPKGKWREVALPEGVKLPEGPLLDSDVFAAIDSKMGELWLIGSRDGVQTVFVTPANAQATVVAPPAGDAPGE